jgi:hypothetical protein
MRSRSGVAFLFVLGFASFASAQPDDDHGIGTVSTASVTTSSVAAVVTPCVANVDTQSIETPFVGTFALTGSAQGHLNVARKGDELIFTGAAAGIPLRHHARVEAPRTWRIALDSTSTGIANNLNGSNNTTSHTRFLVVSDAGKGNLKVVLEFKNKKTDVQATRKKEALVVYGTYENGMKVFANQCVKYYKDKGYEVSLMAGSWQGFADALLAAEATGHTFARVVIVSHGGWDGPMFRDSQYSQISSTYHDEDYWNFIRAFKRGTTLDAKLMVSACHSGGSNRYETWRVDYRYTDEVAKHSGRLVYGLNGSTSTEWSKLLCMFAEGEGPARQETRVSGPGGGRTVMGGNMVVQPPIGNQPLGTP